uniref:Uncharacterized protein n=1 Tax=Anopheles dirus TaxID=7168 RepID=A0A182NUG5_9DIPT
FYTTTDFILQLNELIKHLATYTRDESLDTRETVERAGEMWNLTEVLLEDLVKRSEAAPAVQLRRTNFTDFTLRDALEAIRLQKNNFLAQTCEQLPVDIDAIAIIDPATKSHAVDPAVTLIMHTSVHNLTTVSAQLLHTLEQVESPKIKSTGQARATSQVQPSIQLFLNGFERTFVDTERNFQTQANRAVKRVRSLLSTLDQNQQLGQYVDGVTARITSFNTDVKSLLQMTYMMVETSMTNSQTTIDDQLSTGLSGLLMQAGSLAGSGFLHRCLKRFVYTYYDQSLAVAKLLYCGEPEKKTLEYLETVAIPILGHAVVTATSATQMDVVCSSGSTMCTDNFYTALPTQLTSFDSLMQSYTDFINQELTVLSQRLDTCTQSTAMDVQMFVDDISTKFGTCMNTGSVN